MPAVEGDKGRKGGERGYDIQRFVVPEINFCYVQGLNLLFTPSDLDTIFPY